MGGMQLFGGGSDSETEDKNAPNLKINEEYARRYEHNKNREDLHRYEDLKKRGLVDDDHSDSDSSSEDDDDVVLAANSKKKDLEFFDAIIKVKNRDPILKNKEVELFKSDETEVEDAGNETEDTSLVKEEDSKTKKKKKNSNETEEEEEGSKTKKKKKKVYLKDVVANHLLEDGAELPEDDGKQFLKSYSEEQEQIRREFLEAAAKEEEEDEGEILRVKGSNSAVGDEADEEFDKKLDEYFGQDLDDNARFLRDFFKNKMWLDKGNQGRGATEVRDEDLEMVSEDEMEIERQEEYEYRFQENAGDQVLGHAREVEGSVRKKVKARKEQRKSKEERMEIARLEREEELRHLKNLKKKENDDRVKKIMKIAGIKEGEESLFDSKELENEFDPQEYDRMMKKAFDDEYYGNDDSDFCSDMDEDGGEIEKPDFDKEDELLGLPKGWDGAGSSDGFLAVREKILKLKEETGGDNDEEEEDQEEEKEEDGDEDEDEEGEGEGEEEKEEDGDEDEEGEGEGEEEKLSEEGKQDKKRKLAILERAKKEMLDEYYKLDYEDTIGDLKTRFRYAKIKPNRFGLTTAEVLVMDEKELNQYVSLKKLAPYAEKEWKVPNSKRNEIKKRAREIFRHGKMDHKKSAKKLKIKDDVKDSISSTPAEERGKKQVQDSNGDTSKLSRTARRRLSKKVAALPLSRLIAYGMMPSKSKNKGKQ
ncbi:putative KRR1 interacting protein [Rosa chinensis]|uniref:Putative KRR1 interacting protein n=1 Tax=Rosa chinensis TaxID=74649 RepID=A0A2P6R502_ROSCH|nr:putative KRR1 interacting protein [Rosa chinensis]